MSTNPNKTPELTAPEPKPESKPADTDARLSAIEGTQALLANAIKSMSTAIEKLAVSQHELAQSQQRNSADVLQKHNEAVQAIIAGHDKLQAEAKAKLEDGPQRYKVKIVDARSGTTFNREMLVGGLNEHDAKGKYCDYFGIDNVGAPGKLILEPVGAN